MRILGTLATVLLVAMAAVPVRLAHAHIKSAARPQAASQADPRALIQGSPLEREMTSRETHVYRIKLAANQYLRLTVMQRGIDVTLRLLGPNREPLGEVNNQNATQDAKRISLITEAAGEYQLEVRSVETPAPAGRYKVEIAELRAAIPQDRYRILAEQAYLEGQSLRGQQTAAAKQNALKKLEIALTFWQTIADRREEALTLNSIGETWKELSDNSKALAAYNRALPLLHNLGDRDEEAALLVNIGEVYREAGEYRKALANYEQALPIIRASDNRQKEAITLNNIGLARRALGEYEKALDYYGQSLQLRRAVGDRLGEGRTLGNIGSAYWAMGELSKALEYYQQALPLIRAAGNRPGEATTLSNIGLAYYMMGEKQKALEYYQQALPLKRAAGDRLGEGIALNNIGSLYRSMGEYEQALEFFAQALQLRQAIGDRQGESQTLHNLGVAYRVMGESNKALEYFNRALTLQQTLGDRLGEAASLSNIGQYYAAAGEPQKALEYFNRALPISQTAGDRRGEAVTLADIGSVYAASGEGEKALAHFNQSLALSRAIKDRRGEAQALAEMARVKRDRDQLAAARSDMEAALDIIESLCGTVAIPYRATSFALDQNDYEFTIDLLMRLDKREPQAGHAAAALSVNERARARALFEMLADSRTDIRQGVEPVLLERERTLQQQLNAKADRLTRLLGGKQTDSQAEAAKKELDSTLSDYQDVQAQIRTRSPHYAALTQPVPLNLKAIQQQVLDADTLLLEYALGKERSTLWAVTDSAMTSYELSRREEIEKAARRFYELLTGSNRIELAAQTRLAAEELSRMVLGPVAGQLKNKRLLIVADGALQYVPFAALPAPQASLVTGHSSLANWKDEAGSKANDKGLMTNDNDRPLIADHEIISLPTASALAMLRQDIVGRRPASKQVAVIADPVLAVDDPRVLQASAKTANPAVEATATRGADAEAALVRSAKESGMPRFERLRYTRQEADAIATQVAADRRLKAVDFEANRMTATRPELASYQIVHFATHALINSQHPELSGVVLSLVDQQGRPQDGFLRLHDIYNLKLGADLVVLSACQTTLGKEVKGEGLMGLTRGFMYAGAPRVVASLWDVRDEATAVLMQRFYEGMFRKGLRPAAALREAQVAVWKEKRWEAPYYWAGFTFQGEWK